MVLLRRLAAVDDVLDEHRDALGRDYEAYRHHVYRVANLCIAQLSRSDDDVEKTAVAAVFHDLGIWTDRTFDYLEPSARRAHDYLTRRGRADWIPEVTDAIRQHHKLSACRGPHRRLAEAFRRADWMDVTLGVRSFGLSRARCRAAAAEWPRAGFHLLLARLALRRLATHPWNPLPMVRL